MEHYKHIQSQIGQHLGVFIAIVICCCVFVITLFSSDYSLQSQVSSDSVLQVEKTNSYMYMFSDEGWEEVTFEDSQSDHDRLEIEEYDVAVVFSSTLHGAADSVPLSNVVQNYTMRILHETGDDEHTGVFIDYDTSTDDDLIGAFADIFVLPEDVQSKYFYPLY